MSTDATSIRNGTERRRLYPVAKPAAPQSQSLADMLAEALGPSLPAPTHVPRRRAATTAKGRIKPAELVVEPTTHVEPEAQALYKCHHIERCICSSCHVQWLRPLGLFAAYTADNGIRYTKLSVPSPSLRLAPPIYHFETVAFCPRCL